MKHVLDSYNLARSDGDPFSYDVEFVYRRKLDRRDWFYPLLIAAVVLFCAMCALGQPVQSTRTMQLGVNVDGNNYYVCPGMWSDVSHGFSGWFNCTSYDANGYPLTSGAQSQCNMLGCPAGTYKLSWSGTGTIAVKWATTANVTANSADVIVPKSNNTIQLTATGPVTNVHLFAPGYTASSPTFRTEFTKWLTQFSVIRAMDWAGTNVVKTTATTQPVTWANRVQPAAWDQSTRGTAYEYLLALAAQTKATAWVNVPFMADDDFCRQLASLCAASGQSIYLELGNENWNAQFGQWVQCQSMAKAAGLAPNQYAADRSRQVGLIFRAAMGSRVKVVLSGQCVNPAIAGDGLAYDAGKYGDRPFDALAIASYFPAGTPASGSLATLAAAGSAYITGPMTTGLKAHKALADQYGLQLVCYEGGQSYQSWQNPLGSAADLPYILQTDPLMLGLYNQWLTTCQSCGVTLQMHFSCIKPWGQSGMWGFAQDLAEAPGPKWSAMSTFAALPFAVPVAPATTQVTVGAQKFNVTITPGN